MPATSTPAVARHDPAAKAAVRTRRVRLLWWGAAYLALLGLSHAVIMARGLRSEEPFEPGDERAALVELPAMDDGGAIDGERMRMAYLEWGPPAGAGAGAAPVVLLHGSPGRGRNFDQLAPLLAERGYRVIAPDMPGFGDSTIDVPRYSTEAHAHAVRAMLDELGIGRAHLVGWSMGGGVAFHLVDMQPERYASLTLLAAVGDMSMEGSGSYAFEKFKYGVGYALLVGGPELVPHFGLLGTRETPAGQFRHSFIRNFLDTDQREYTEIMRRLRTPTMILHGRDDFLVPDYAAELSHELIEPSRLVMLDASHFLPFMQAEETADHLAPFLARHDAAADGEGPSAPVRQRVDLAPTAEVLVDELIDDLVPAFRAVPWWVLVIAVAAASALLPTGATLAAALLSSALLMDYGVAIAGLLVGLSARRGPPFGALPSPRSIGHRALAVLVGAPIMFIAGTMMSRMVVLPAGEHIGLVGLACGFVVSLAVLRALPRLPSREGRRELRVRWRRAMHHEFWPGWLFYLPMWPCWVWMAIRARHPLAFTCCNAAIQPGGGVIGESKQAILDALGSDPECRACLLPAALVPASADPEARCRAAIDLILGDPALGGFPVVLKPDSGFRGFDVRIARREEDVRAYFHSQTRPVQVQAYHAGPHEVGVVWARSAGAVRPAGDGEGGGRGLSGSIYSITRKDFPILTGDGERTLRELILAHPRYRLQGAVFLTRLSDRLDTVPGAGERVRLAEAGNHCQGTLFRDGSDLITPELEAQIDRLARRMGAAPGEGGDADTQQLDYGRFDIRFADEDELRAGRIDGIVELNGVTGEPTALYDPSRSLLWSYGLLYGQWRRLFQLGALRRDAGTRPMGVREVLRAMRAHYRGRPGSAVAD